VVHIKAEIKTTEQHTNLNIGAPHSIGL